MSCPNDLCGFVYGDTALAGIVAGFINKRVFYGHFIRLQGPKF